MDAEKINRINELAKKHRDGSLTPEEAEERRALHAEYIAAYRASLRHTLEHTVVQRPDGTREKIQKKQSGK